MAAIPSVVSLIEIAVPAATAAVQLAEQLTMLVQQLHVHAGTEDTAAQIRELRKRLDDVNARVQAVTFP